MQNISKREYVILGIMAVVILYGIVTLFHNGKGTRQGGLSPETRAKELQTLAANATISMGKDVLSGREAYAIGRIEAQWLHDPFYDKAAYSELIKTNETVRAAAVTARVNFTYTGYMESKGLQFAIINGLEYMVGEALDVPGYILSSISPAKVIIGNKADNRVKLEVPIQD